MQGSACAGRSRRIGWAGPRPGSARAAQGARGEIFHVSHANSCFSFYTSAPRRLVHGRHVPSCTLPNTYPTPETTLQYMVPDQSAESRERGDGGASHGITRLAEGSSACEGENDTHNNQGCCILSTVTANGGSSSVKLLPLIKTVLVMMPLVDEISPSGLGSTA